MSGLEITLGVVSALAAASSAAFLIHLVRTGPKDRGADPVALHRALETAPYHLIDEAQKKRA